MPPEPKKAWTPPMVPDVLEIMSLSGHAFENGDMACARQVEPLEQVVDDLQKEIKTNKFVKLTAYVAEGVLVRVEKA